MRRRTWRRRCEGGRMKDEGGRLKREGEWKKVFGVRW